MISVIGPTFAVLLEKADANHRTWLKEKKKKKQKRNLKVQNEGHQFEEFMKYVTYLHVFKLKRKFHGFFYEVSVNILLVI